MHIDNQLKILLPRFHNVYGNMIAKEINECCVIQMISTFVKYIRIRT
jgi:hypothetical protein